MTLTTAESCTGGLISAYITELEGSSQVFWGSFITYSNESKVELLSINENILLEFGAVSKETVELMASKALTISGASCSIAVSGIAGPGGGSEEKPVGTVWISVNYNNESSKTEKKYFKGNRYQIRKKTVESSILMLYQLLLENKLLTVHK